MNQSDYFGKALKPWPVFDDHYIYSLLGTCKLNGVEPERWLRQVISKIGDWPSNRVHELLPWNLLPVK